MGEYMEQVLEKISLKIVFRDLFPEVAVCFQNNFLGCINDEGVAGKLAKILYKDVAIIETILSLEAQNLLDDYHHFIFHRRMPQTRWLNEQLGALFSNNEQSVSQKPCREYRLVTTG